MKSPLVSVVITTCNRLEILKETVACVLNQTFKDYELIISDDNSNDGTDKWVQSLVKKHKNIINFRHKQLGMVGNWNAGVKKANGKYIALLMDDDLWDKDFLKETVKILDKHPQVGFVDTWVVPFVVTETGEKKFKDENFYRIRNQSCVINGRSCITQYLTTNWLVGLPSSILCRRKCFDELGYFNELGLDPEMWLRICSKYDMYYLDKKLIFWRTGNTSFSSNQVGDIKKINRKLATLNLIRDYYIENDKLKIKINKIVNKKIFEYKLICFKKFFNSNSDMFMSINCFPLLIR